MTVRARREAGEVVVELLYGSGRTEDELRRLFEPFGSRESAESGRPASLALYVVRRLVEAHGGRVAAGRDGRAAAGPGRPARARTHRHGHPRGACRAG